jgi:hypothetical protein
MKEDKNNSTGYNFKCVTPQLVNKRSRNKFLRGAYTSQGNRSTSNIGKSNIIKKNTCIEKTD